MFRLDHVVRNYPWGSLDQIPRFLGLPPAAEPVAEIWLGAHRTASATVARGEDDAGVPLREIIARSPVASCGPDAPPELPFLLKLLGVASPLSLQVHPGAEQARAGFAREEAAGIPLAAPNRTYKDPYAKAEMIYALESFEVLAGFRPPEEIRRTLAPLAANSALAAALAQALEPGGYAGLRAVLATALVDPCASAEAVAQFTAACRHQLAVPGGDPGPYATILALARRYPDDPALPLVMMMNHVSLAPGEALFIPPGTLHTYLRGTAIELLTGSDNTLRAGLTSKYVDRARVAETVDVAGRGPLRPAVSRTGGIRAIRPPTDQFQLADIKVAGTSEVPLAGPRIALVLEGEATAFTELGSLHVGRGQSLFAMASEGNLTLRGKGRVIVAAPGERYRPPGPGAVPSPGAVPGRPGAVSGRDGAGGLGVSG
ncbi:MAG: mannose-6-phosphate isomerase, class I [Bifidobacteriaceae bacterium]|nr:mannose-6-phosphate isomerase, class I [Bifidobacteriaceae bacterium]